MNTIYSTYSLTRSRAGIQLKSGPYSRLGKIVPKTPHFPRILVTGSNGRLGRLLRGATLAAKPPLAQVLFAARSGNSDIPAFDAQSIPSDLPPADMVVGLWGVTSGSRAELAQNTDLVSATNTLARLTGASRVIHMSSAGVYGPGTDLSEHSPTKPASDYGHAKMVMEANVAQLEIEGVFHCCLRLANVVGADSLAPALRARNSQPVTLTRFQDGHGPRRSYVSPGHLLEILCALAQLPADQLPPLLNVSASAPIEMEALARAAGKDIAWKARTPADTQTVTLSTHRLAALLPGVRLHKSAQDMIHDWQASEAQA